MDLVGMTEKRFEFREVHNGGITLRIWDNEKQEYANLLECVDWLNELAEENNEFKINEEFKNKAYSDLLDNFTQLKKKYQKSKKENKELKQLIKKVMDERVVDYPLLCKIKEMVKE